MSERISAHCHYGEHARCGGQVKFANADGVDDCYQCTCTCHKTKALPFEDSAFAKWYESVKLQRLQSWDSYTLARKAFEAGRTVQAGEFTAPDRIGNKERLTKLGDKHE